ncbi:hypothetical protein DdX_04860 [Ditylenchus destructor]|uniref:Uncharacterized protein n=1 Tax=Ditylenchus destructor TaxID=166010 RepID=A0AAD4NDA6_9BILA|nr:hypothetical protein DdX_04860 [Ditylenchus destructor]
MYGPYIRRALGISSFTLCTFVLLTIATSYTDARFILSCRVIAEICHGDVHCLKEMSHQFPDCYTGLSPIIERATDINSNQHTVGSSSGPMSFADFGPLPPLEKRTRLMNVLMKVDRIAAG